eukprot:3178690-Alexandrium_andersonii.AAC.1
MSRMRGHFVCDKEGPPLIPDATLGEAEDLRGCLQKCCAVRKTILYLLRNSAEPDLSLREPLA